MENSVLMRSMIFFYIVIRHLPAVDPYALLNFKIGYDRGVGWSGYVEARNLLDARYISTTITAGRADPTMQLFNPGTGRAIYGGLRYRLWEAPRR